MTGIALLSVSPPGRSAVAQSVGAQSPAIADNSFLIEEAYNQEPGVVQHISAWQRSLRSAAWGFTFTQEWPLGTQTLQLRYTIPLQPRRECDLVAATDGSTPWLK